MATQDQKDQLNALFLTKLKPADLDKDRLQVFLSDPKGISRFAAEFIGTYERRTYPVVTATGLPQPKFPDWSKGRVLQGDIRRGESMDFVALTTTAWFHPNQLGDNSRPTGHDILAALVASYKAGEDKVGNFYPVAETDAIHGHFGLAELTYMQDNWTSLPEPFKAWARGKLLYGWRDVVRDGNGGLYGPFLLCFVDKPYVRWYDLDNSWDDSEVALREQVGTQA